jgi:hypothetical protein
MIAGTVLDPGTAADKQEFSFAQIPERRAVDVCGHRPGPASSWITIAAPRLLAAAAAELLLQSRERHVAIIDDEVAGLHTAGVAAAAARDPEVAPAFPGVLQRLDRCLESSSRKANLPRGISAGRAAVI